MCADCHSTNLLKQYDPVLETYQTTWSDMEVNCESCHGPGSAHLEWAAIPELARPMDVNTGLVVNTGDKKTREYADLCARCHLRRSALGDHNPFSTDLLDGYIPHLTGQPLYFTDGQILEELVSAFVPLLCDPVLAVRTEAAMKLSYITPEKQTTVWKAFWKDALGEYMQALLYSSDFAGGSFNLGNHYSRMGEFKEAEHSYLKAINIDSEFFPAKVNLAMLYNARKENEKAELLFREVISIQPENGEFYYSLGLLLAEMERYSEALEMLQKAVILLPDRPRVKYNLFVHR